MTKKMPRTAIRGESSNQHNYQERTRPMMITNPSDRKPFPPTETLVDAIHLDRNRERTLEDIFAETAALHEVGEPPC